MTRTSSLFTTAAVVALGALCASSAMATEPFARVSRPISITVLDAEQGIRNVGMGATGVSNIAQPTTGYYNPATLAWMDGAAATMSYRDYRLLDEDFRNVDWRVVLGHRWGGESSPNLWRLGGVVGYTTFAADPQEERTIFLPEGTGNSYQIDDYYLTYALAGGWERRGVSIAAGATAKYVNLSFGSETDDGWAFDYGFVMAFPISVDGSLLQPRVGVSSANNDNGFIADSTEYDIANQSRIGAGLDLATPKRAWKGREVALASASFDVDYTDRESSRSSWAVGWEASILELVQVRAGFQWYENNSDNVHYLGLGVGWDFGRWNVHGDYAHEAPTNSYFDIDLTRDLWGASVGARF